MSSFGSLNYSLRLSLVLIAVIGLVSIGIAGPQAGQKDADHKGLRCGDVKLDTVLGHPENYFGKTVTVEGEMHRTFTDKVFSIEDDDFLRDDDLLIISHAPKSEVAKPVKDSIAEGKDVCVTGVIQPFHRAEMEKKFGPLNIESRASHYPEGSPVMIIEEKKADTASFEREKPLPISEAEPVTEPVPTELQTKSEETNSPQREETYSAQREQTTEETAQQTTDNNLPATASPIPLIGLSGVLSMLAAAGIRLRRR